MLLISLLAFTYAMIYKTVRAVLRCSVVLQYVMAIK